MRGDDGCRCADGYGRGGRGDALRQRSSTQTVRRTLRGVRPSPPVPGSSQASPTRRPSPARARLTPLLRQPSRRRSRACSRRRARSSSSTRSRPRTLKGSRKSVLSIPDFRLPSYSLAGLMMISEQPTEAERLLGEAFATGKDPAEDKFVATYLFTRLELSLAAGRDRRACRSTETRSDLPWPSFEQDRRRTSTARSTSSSSSSRPPTRPSRSPSSTPTRAAGTT